MLTKKEPTKTEPKATKNASNANTSTATTTATNTTTTTNTTATEKRTGTTSTTPTGTHATQATEPFSTSKSQQKTRITVKYDVGFNNQVTIRGKGAQLSWERGQPLKNIKNDEWVFETDGANQLEFKVLINDRVYENGDNHFANNGANIVYTPRF